MKKIVLFSIGCFFIFSKLGHSQNKISTYFFGSFTKTIQDRTLGNNPWGIGLGIQTNYINHTRFTPLLDFTGDLYLEDDKVLSSGPDGKAIPAVGGVINLFAGCCYNITQQIFIAFSLGPSLINGEALFGIKPALGFCFPKNQRWVGKLSFTNIFNRESENFETISLSIGVKLH